MTEQEYKEICAEVQNSGIPKQSQEMIIDALKEKPKCKDCAGCTVWKCDCANIRSKAIDEFAEQIQVEISESIIWDMLVTMDKNGSISDTSDKIADYVIDTSKKIAEQLKARSDEDARIYR